MNKIKSKNLKAGVNLSGDKGHVDLYLLGEFGWEITIESVIETLQGYENVETMTVYINSIGGSFDAGLPIINYLNNLPAEKTTCNLGYALSMGSLVLMGVKGRVLAAQNSLIMIHRAQGMVFGDAEEMRKTAGVVEKHEQAVIPIYQARFAEDIDVFAVMQAETWYTADEALAAGLIDGIVDPIDIKQLDKTLPKNAWQHAVSAYKNMPVELRTRAESYAEVSKKGLLTKILDAVVGENPPLIIPETEEDVMTKEELEAALSANNAQLAATIETNVVANLSAEFETKLAAVKPKSEDEVKDAEIARLKAVLAEKSAVSKDDEIAQLKANIAALSTPHNPKTIPFNKGDSEDSEQDDC